MAYDQVNRALANIGQGITQGFRDIGSAKMSAAEFALKEAQTLADLEERRMKLPVLRQQAKQAENYLVKQQQLDQPLTTNDVMFKMLGANPQDHTIRHIFENDIPGHLLKATGIKYRESDDRYLHPDGRVVSRRDFEMAKPIVEATLVARTDPLKMGQDLLSAAESRGDKSAIAKINKNLSNPNWLLQQYDKQEQYLINAKSGMGQFGYNTESIDDSLQRIGRKRAEILANIKLDKTLAAKKMEIKPGITQKDIAGFYMKAYEQADKRMDSMALDGSFEGWDDAKIEAYRRNLAGTMVFDALSAADVVQPKKGVVGGIDTSRFKGKGKKVEKGTFKKIMDTIKTAGGVLMEPSPKDGPKFGSGVDALGRSVKQSLGITKGGAAAGKIKRLKIRIKQAKEKGHTKKAERLQKELDALTKDQ